MKITSKFLNNAPLIFQHGMAVLLLRLGRRDFGAVHLLLKELLHEGKLIETLVEEEEREKKCRNSWPLPVHVSCSARMHFV